MTSPAFDLIGLTQLRNDPRYRGIDGEIDNEQNLAVAVIDTGIQGSHPLLDDNFTAFVNFAEDAGPEGSIITNSTQSFDTDSHGTHVAGTVGSEDESIGVATGVDLISLQVFSQDGFAYNRDTLEALEWVLNNRNEYNIVAVNMSLGGGFYPPDDPSQDPYVDIINRLEQAGITVVSAAGNSYNDLPPGVPRQNIGSPAISSTLAVGAVHPGSWYSFREPDEIANFSQRLQFDRMIFAPGVDINSTVPVNSQGELQGTSMASPMVAGAVALLQEAALQFGNRKLTPYEVREILLQTADEIIDGDDEYFNPTGETFLRMNVYNAVQEVERRLSGGNSNPNPDPDTNPTDPNGIISRAISLENDIDITLEQLNQLTTVASGSIGTDAETIDVGATDVDLFSFNVPDAGGLVTIQTSVNDANNQVDTILRLFDANGNEITIDDDGGDGRFSRIEAILESGQYFAGVSGYNNAYYNPTVADSGISGGTGTYSLQLQFESGITGSTTDQNGTIADSLTQDALFFDELEMQYVGITIGSDPVAGVSERVAVGRTDVDMVRFDVDTAGLMVLETFESDPDDRLDSVMRLFDATGNQLASNDDGGQGFFSRIETELNPGTYYVGVSGFDNSNYNPNSLENRIEGSTGTATLEFFFQPSGNTDPNGIRIGAELLELTPGTTTVLFDSIGSDYGSDNQIIEVNDADVDLFEFVAPETGLLLIDTDTPFISNFADTFVRLFDGNGNEIGFSDDDPGEDIYGNQIDFPIRDLNDFSYDFFGNFIGHGTDSFLPAFVEAGETYFIGVSGYGNGGYSIDNLDNRSAIATGGLYDLYLTYVTSLDDDGTIATATPLDLSLQVNGNIGFDNSTDVGNNDVDFYKVNSAQGGLLDIQIDAFADFSLVNPVDSIVFLFDEQGNQLAFNDDSPFSLDSELQYFINPDTNYYIAVSGYGNFEFDPDIAGSGFAGSTGDYALNAQVLQPEESNSNSNIYATAFNNALESNGGSFSNLLLDVDREIFGTNFNQIDTNSLDYLELGSSITASLGEDVLGSASNNEFSSFSSLYTTEVSQAIFGNSQSSSFDSGADDVDYFRIRIDEAGRYDLRAFASSTEFGTLGANTSLRLYDDQGNQISDNQNTVGVSGTDSRVLVSINQPGDYWIAVLPEAEATQRFDFQSHSFGTLTDDEVQQLSQSAGEYQLEANPFTLQAVGTPVLNDGAISVEFNDVLNLDRLSLYDGPDAETLDLSSLTVIDSNGNPVRGSLVVENNQVIFVPTNPLDAGTYTLTYSSNDFITQFGSENSQFQSLEMLDGDRDGTSGGDLNTDVSVADSNAIKITVPSFARGPGQSVDIGQSGSGLPISVSNAEAFTDITLRLEYNPELLNITDVVLASGLPGDWQINGLEISDGQAIVDLAGSTALEAGATDLIKLVANVPENATFNNSQVLRVSGGAIDEDRNPIALEESAAVHKVAFLADPNADGIIDFGDVLAVANLFLSDDISGFDRFDLTDPVLIGDANRDNIVDFGDVLAVAQEFLGDSSLIPSADNTLIPEAPIGPDPEVTISTATGQPGETVSVTVSLTDTNDAPDGVAAFNLGIRYPTDQLSITPSDIQLSQELTDLGFINPFGFTVDETAGLIKFGVINGNVPQGATPTIATLNFSVPEGATPGEVIIDLSEDPTETGLFDPDSTRLTLTAVDGSITIDGGDDPNTPPTITSNTSFSVAENSTTVGTITANDSENNDLSFSISGGADQELFTINSSSGELNFKDAPDFENAADDNADNNYQVQVSVSDSRETVTQDLTISVTDVDEVEPQPPTIEDTTFTIDENSDAGTQVGIISATDPENGGLTFAITTGNLDSDNDENLAFAINQSTGVITVNDKDDLDFETTSIFNLGVTATNPSGLSNTGNITVNIKDIPPAVFDTSSENGIFTLNKADSTNIKFTLASNNTENVNEVGVFVVEDEKGSLDGLAPGSEGYLKAALERSQVIFSAIADRPSGFDLEDIESVLEVDGDARLGFYLVSNGTTDTALAELEANGTTSLSIFFSDSSNLQIADLDENGFNLNWSDQVGGSDFNDMELSVQLTQDVPNLGNKLQKGVQEELIDLSDLTGQVSVNVKVHREASFDSVIGFYQVADSNGGIDINADGVIDFNVGDAGYKEAALENRVTGLDLLKTDNQQTTTFNGTFNGGSTLASFIVVNGTVDEAINNSAEVYFSFLGANSDGVDHIRSLGNNTFGFEDLFGGGDNDFNDMIVEIDFPTV